MSNRSHARAYDTIDDTMRYDAVSRRKDKADATDTLQDGATVDTACVADTIDDGFPIPFTEEELMVKTGVDFLRTPRNEAVIFDCQKYLGKTRVKNMKYGYNYEAHFWLVRFSCVADMEYEQPKLGLLQIRTRNIRLSGFASEVRSLFAGRTRLVADSKGRILSISDY